MQTMTMRGMSLYVLLVVGWAALSFVSITFTRQPVGLALIWPANALLTAVILTSSRRIGQICTALVAATSVALILTINPALLMAGAVPAAHVIEAVLVAVLTLRFAGSADLFTRPGHVAGFVLATIIGVLPSAIAIGLLLAPGLSASPFAVGFAWFATHACGQIIVAPMLVVLRRRNRVAKVTRATLPRLAQSGLPLVLVAMAGLIVFTQWTHPLLFLAVPPLLFATFRMGVLGAALGTLILAVIGTVCLITGVGPLANVPGTIAAKGYVLQMFVATMFLFSLPVATIIAQSDRQRQLAERRAATLRMVANRIEEVLFRTDGAGRWVYLSSAYEKVTGRSVADSIGKPFLTHIPAEESKKLAEMAEALRAGAIDEAQAETMIIDESGTPRDIQLFVYRLKQSGDENIGFGGLFRDITPYKKARRETERRAAEAERTAKAHESAALTDDLTRLPNRRAFTRMLEEEILRTREEGIPLSLIAVDIDHFKRVNDSFGHAAGDLVLRRVAEILNRSLRTGAIVARTGGEEFAILLTGADVETACIVGHRALANVAAERIDLGGDLLGASALPLRVTVSLGVAEAGADDTPETLKLRADRRLYQAKQEGRNRLVRAA
ncbi:MAG: hypothetical protein JWM38_2659 [Sphingomonas bacterium]|nr:hypothetical protein [Sphingomonas bacterium]